MKTNNKKHIIDRRLFMEWVLEDSDDFWNYREVVIDSILTGKPLTIDYFFENVGYIPKHIIKNSEGILDDEFDPSECELEEEEGK